MLDTVNALECSGHTFELIPPMVRENGFIRAQFAIDGHKCPPFYEPVAHTVGLNEKEFILYMQAQALTMLQYDAT